MRTRPDTEGSISRRMAQYLLWQSTITDTALGRGGGGVCVCVCVCVNQHVEKGSVWSSVNQASPTYYR